jgi:acetyl esterase/lipase
LFHVSVSSSFRQGNCSVLYKILGSTFISPFKLNGVTHSAYTTSAFNYTGVEQKTRAFLETLQRQGGPPIYTLSPEEARAVLSNLLKQQPPIAMPPADIENRTIPGGPNGSNISINIVRPQGSNEETLLPVVMYFHGGGWVCLAVLILMKGW